eukprot:5298701-Pyramimonas_sp.AAC.1
MARPGRQASRLPCSATPPAPQGRVARRARLAQAKEWLAPPSAGAPQLTADERLQLAALRDKLGDSRSTAAHRTAAAAPSAPAP